MAYYLDFQIASEVAILVCFGILSAMRLTVKAVAAGRLLGPSAGSTLICMREGASLSAT